MKPANLKVRWWEWVVPIAIVAGMAAVLFPIFDASFYPPPDAAWLKRCQQLLDDDGLPITADTLIHHEIDRGTGLMDGPMRMDWDDFCRTWKAEPVADKPGTVIVLTKKGDYARLRNLGDGRVRVVSGHDNQRERAFGIFDKEMKSGKGRHRAYRKP